MDNNTYSNLPEESQQYISLVEFLIAQEADGTITTREFSRLMAADANLYRGYLSLLDGDPADIPPFSAAQAVAEIQSRLAAWHPSLVDEAGRVTGRPNKFEGGVSRYFDLVEFLDRKVDAGQLKADAHQTLVNIDADLHQNYVRMKRDGAAIEIREPRAQTTADAIYRLFSSRHPALAREYDQLAATRGR